MIHHSDAGSQYTSIRFTGTLAFEGLSASIGTVGDALATDYVNWYNNHRLHSLLSNATPEEFEQAYYAHQTGSPTGAAANQKTA